MENKNIVYVLVGLLVGVLITTGFFVLNRSENPNLNYVPNGVHTMPDGTLMNNVPMDMDHMMSGMMAGLEGKTGDAFDKEFLAEMIVHHQGAVEMAQAVLKSSKRPELLKLANDIITAQTGEIKMMQDWEKVWFN